VQWIVSFVGLPWYNLLLFYVGLIAIIILLPDQIIKFVKKAKPKEIGPIKFNNDEDSLVNHPEVRDYLFQITNAFEEIKADLRYRLRTNGWEKIENIEEYINAAINQFDIMLTQYLDKHYYFNSSIDRMELFTYNKIIWLDVKDNYYTMFQNMVKIIKEQKKEMERCEKELDELMSGKNCKKNQKCIVATDIIKIVTKITIDDNITIIRRCMIEAERTIAENVQLYYGHYLGKLKDLLLKKS